MFYSFRQDGDFIDFKTNDVFPSYYASSGWTGTAYGAAGVDYSLGPRFALTSEARYTWSSAELSRYCTLIESTFTVWPSSDPDMVAFGLLLAGLPLRAVDALALPAASSL